MATKTQPAREKPAAQEKPATQKPASQKKPAAEKPAASTGVGIKELAKKLNRDPRSVRASIRRVLGGPQVGKGKRYQWASETDPEFVSLYDKLSGESKDES